MGHKVKPKVRTSRKLTDRDEAGLVGMGGRWKKVESQRAIRKHYIHVRKCQITKSIKGKSTAVR